MAKNITLIDIVIFILFVISVYFVLTRIFGHSASDIAISISLFTLLGGLIYKLNREFGEFKIKTINSFDRMRLDINSMREDIKEIKNRL